MASSVGDNEERLRPSWAHAAWSVNVDLTRGGCGREWVTFSVSNIMAVMSLDRRYQVLSYDIRAMPELALITYRHGAKPFTSSHLILETVLRWIVSVDRVKLNHMKLLFL